MVRVRGGRVNIVLWAARAAWVSLPFTVGPALGDAVHGWDAAVRSTATIGLWGVWLAVLVASLVPLPVALTVWRIGAPAPTAAVAVAAATRHASLLATVFALAAVALAFTPAVGLWAVNGPAYGDERRYPLRTPVVVLFGPAVVSWVVTVGAPVAAVLLLAQQRWVIGGVVALLGGGGAFLAARALHGLSRRWLVFVPAGIVVHDPIALADPVLFQRGVVTGIGPAPAEAGDGRLDLTAGAAGLALAIRFREPTGVMTITKAGRRPTAEKVDAGELLVTPTRASAVLADAAARGYTVA